MRLGVKHHRPVLHCLFKMFSLVLKLGLLGLVVCSPAINSKEDVRIVGGEDIDIKEAPYQVSVMFMGSHTCGGTVIDKDIVITAAHCIVGSNPSHYKVRVGSSFSHKGGKIHSVGDLTWHSGFSFYNMDYDVSILWLSEPLSFSESVMPIELANMGDEISDGEDTIVTGWGHMREGGGIPSVLQKVLVPKVNEAVCDNAYQPLYKITPRMMCAGAPQGGKDACQGDSGGPLVHKNRLAGVVSWGLGCARPEYPGVYTKISSLRNWIEENIVLLRLKHILKKV